MELNLKNDAQRIWDFWKKPKAMSIKVNLFFKLRYHSHLNSTTKNGKLSEDDMIEFFAMHDEMGNKWSQISKKFRGLTDNYLKNIFHSKLRGAIRALNRYVKENWL